MKYFGKTKGSQTYENIQRTDVHCGASAHGVSRVCLYRGVVLRGQTYPQARLLPFWPASACMLNNNNTSKHENLTFTKACLTQYSRQQIYTYMHTIVGTTNYNLQYILDEFTTTDISHRFTFSFHPFYFPLSLSLPFSHLHTDCLSCFVIVTFSIICKQLLYL